MALDPLAVLLRERFDSPAALARASGLAYERLRTYTDGLWRAASPPPPDVLVGLEAAVGAEPVQAAVLASLAHRLQQTGAVSPLSWGQRVVLEALRGFDDTLLVAVAPHVYELVTRQARLEPPAGSDPCR